MKLINSLKYENIVRATLVVAPDNLINNVLSDIFVEPRRALTLRYLYMLYKQGICLTATTNTYIY
jgi:ATP-dependent protease Clp ATPase subunit